MSRRVTVIQAPRLGVSCGLWEGQQKGNDRSSPQSVHGEIDPVLRKQDWKIQAGNSVLFGKRSLRNQ